MNFKQKFKKKMLMVLLCWLQVSLRPDCKNLGSGVPILMAADKPCPQLQPSLRSLG